MSPKDIDKFFALLKKEIDFRVTIILTGGGAAILEGVSRATQDLDFQIVLKNANEKRRLLFQSAIQTIERRSGIVAQYETDIEMWSSIAWPSATPKSYHYKNFGDIEVRILDPLWWSVGKMIRYLSYDVTDVITVFRKMKVSPEQAARAWGKALGRSPLSNAQPIFQRQVLDFFEQHGSKTWNKSIDVVGLQNLFLKTARQAAKHRTRHR